MQVKLHDQTLEQFRAQLWIRSYCAHIESRQTSTVSSTDAARTADKALEEFNERFKPGTPYNAD